MPEILAKLVYILGIFFINPLVLSRYKELKKTEFLSDQHLNEIQERKLNALLHHAKETSPYYRSLLADLDIDSISLTNLDKIPVLSKETLRTQSSKIYSDKYSSDQLIKSETSGSTGDAFVFFRDKNWDACHRAVIWRGLNQYGVEPWERNLYLWGFVFTKSAKIRVKLLDFLQNRFRIFQINEFEIERNLKKIRNARFISGYSSVIDTLVGLVEGRGKSLPKLKLLKGTSEKIYDSYQKRALRVLGLPIVSEYGAAETGIISYTCPFGRDHTIRENIILETVNGRAVITNLESYSMPIIRYDLGDYIEVEHVTCECGRHSQVVKDILGRVGVNIFGEKNEYPSLSLYYIFKELALVQNMSLSYQGVQEVKGRLKILIFEDASCFDARVVEEVAVKYLPDVEVHVMQAELDTRQSKLKDFVSFVETN